MKTKLSLIILISFTTLFFGCGKKGSHDKPKGYFIKKIEMTYHVLNIGNRALTFQYDDKNRIKSYDFDTKWLLYHNTITYNDAGLITQIDADQLRKETGVNTGYIYEFRYAGDKLVEFKESGTIFRVTYNAAQNRYSTEYFFYEADANNHLQKYGRNSSSVFTEINYSSNAGIFRNQNVPFVLSIFHHESTRNLSEQYDWFIDPYAFSKNEIGFIRQLERRFDFVSTRDDKGNITEVNVFDKDGNLYLNFKYAYEVRSL